MQKFHTSPLVMFSAIAGNRHLTWSLVKREVLGRYRGSMFGILWSFFNPLLMLLIYTLVFSVVFKARWAGGSGSKIEFAMVLFSGLMVFNVFSECINRAPSLILMNINYVKKVVFPLEILPVVSLGSALFHGAVSFLVWLIFYCVFFGMPAATAWLFPIVLLPMLFIMTGLSWLLASLGVYLRDVTQVVMLLTTALMFLSPIFYPVSALPMEYQHVMQWNPMTSVIEDVRAVLIQRSMPEWGGYSLRLAGSILVAWVGFAWFQKTREGFADVL
ncbi:ABC transporter permease [Xanthomonas sp. NCPPB 1068]|uniref:ABC transporter permease n=1 Tax=Xanthomonas sp. NCPPB 1068 TaxID=487525 RepID=UPI003556EB83